jgi:ribonuclease Y
MSTTTAIVIGVVALGLGGLIGWFLNNRFGSRSVEASRTRSDEILRSARRAVQKEKQAAVLETRQEILQQRDRAEKDLRNRKRQMQKKDRELRTLRTELAEREAELQGNLDGLKEAEEALNAREDEIRQKREQAEHLVEEQNVRLERVGGLTQDEARRQLLTNLKAKTRYDAAQMIREIKDEAQRNAEKEAVKIMALAIERAASDFSAERTVSTFKLPEGSDLKGRIIGHEGKNIRAFEKATGIQLLIDEDSNSVQMSGFNPVRREIARRVLETLIKDGNIHPKRIEELVRRNNRRLEEEMKKAGQEALRELKIRNVHPEIVKLVGRLKFRTSYGQNVLDHSKEVAYLTGMLAAELRLDEKLARRAGLLHDIGKAIDYEREGTHPEIGAEVGEKYGEDPVVVNAIASHHEDCEVTSPISVLVSAADSLSGARPGARRASVAEYIKRIERLEELANSMKGVEQSYALHAGREIRVIAKSKLVDDARVDLLASDLANRIQTEMDYPGKIKVTVIRETRAVEYAS